MYDSSIKDLMVEQFGKRRGSLWRSEREWYAFGAKDPNINIKEGADYVKDRRAGLVDEKGFSKTRKMRYMGSIPEEVAFANPELLYDPDIARQFFAEFPDFSSKGR